MNCDAHHDHPSEKPQNLQLIIGWSGAPHPRRHLMWCTHPRRHLTWCTSLSPSFDVVHAKYWPKRCLRAWICTCVSKHDLVSTLVLAFLDRKKANLFCTEMQASVPASRDASVEQAVQVTLSDTVAQLTALWQTLGVCEHEQQQQKDTLVAMVEKICKARVNSWRHEVERATARVVALERDVQTLKTQFQGHGIQSTGHWCIRSLDQLCHGALREKLVALEMEFKFLDSIRTSRVAEINKLHEQLRAMDKKLGTTTTLPTHECNLSEEFKATLQELVTQKSREVHTRRAALLEAVSECEQLAQELQLAANDTFAAEITARLKKRDLSTDLLQQIAQRTVELREMALKHEAQLAEMLGQIHDLWRVLKISEKDQERFQRTLHGVGKAALASCEAELTRLQRYHKRLAATTVQIVNLRRAIEEHWDLLGYTSDQRAYFRAMMTTPDAQLSYRVFRAHEKEIERLKGHVSAMRFLTHYVVKREEILQVRAEHGVPDEQTREQIERELPKYTAILLNRIGKWEKETGVVFRWKGKPYLEQLRVEDPKREKQRSMTKQATPQQTRGQQRCSPSGGLGHRRRHIQTNRHSIEARPPTRFSGVEEQLHRRRSDPPAPQRPRWRKFIRSTFSRYNVS
ncbi:hypothetical protein PsorP6_014094 [Peronosclerospora sorghi]|uniref:Uncharacterized protein n=1 Tax=Peronosclerospora sorghi TaxID=230839 RepID=A0ACC0VHX6_9STRA|nr:hypothetical protein PsorP6_014094 [Peronosclerospora sorghi]